VNLRVLLHKDSLILIGLTLIGAVMSYIDNMLGFQTILVESIHALVVTAILVFCLVCQYRNPEIRQFGWNKILLGVFLLMIGSWVDILDDPPTLSLIQIAGIPFGRSWEQAFIKKILGYSVGIGLIAYGLFQWIPWMIETRLNVQKLNQRLSQANKKMNRMVMSLDEHIESERLNISRELHDDVAQQLTYLNFQLQLCHKEVDQEPKKAQEHIKVIAQELSEALKSVRQISGDLRPEPLYALGLIPALEQFMDKIRQQNPGTEVLLYYNPLTDEDDKIRIESRFNERELLHLYRVMQESIRNAIKHGNAYQIDVYINEEANQFRFIIEDNGIGLPWLEMPTADALVQDGHLGIAGLQERVKELSGKFDLTNKSQNSGARMEITVAK
jgi:signal transduction histidine kinase